MFFAALILVISFVLLIAAADGLLDLLTRIFAAMPAVPRSGDGPPISRIRRWTAAILFYAVHAPFGLIWEASLAISQKWKLSMSEGREYRSGYQDPGRLDNSGANPIDPFADKGTIMSTRLERTFHYYKTSWVNFSECVGTGIFAAVYSATVYSAFELA